MSTKTAEASPTVLIVEDEESFVDALTIGLRREGSNPRRAVTIRGLGYRYES